MFHSNEWKVLWMCWRMSSGKCSHRKNSIWKCFHCWATNTRASRSDTNFREHLLKFITLMNYLTLLVVSFWCIVSSFIICWTNFLTRLKLKCSWGGGRYFIAMMACNVGTLKVHLHIKGVESTVFKLFGLKLK